MGVVDRIFYSQDAPPSVVNTHNTDSVYVYVVEMELSFTYASFSVLVPVEYSQLL
jgi:hypothetical protein